MVAHTSKVTDIMSDRCAGVCKELIVHFILYFDHTWKNIENRNINTKVYMWEKLEQRAKRILLYF
jgi:hypothetical protein